MPSGSDFQDSVDKTREAFRRSAPEGHDLALPVRDNRMREMEHEAGGEGDGDAGDVSIPANLHPFFRGLLATLPEPGADWPLARRERWLETARNIFALIYADPDDERRPIRLATTEPPAAPRESRLDTHSA